MVDILTDARREGLNFKYVLLDGDHPSLGWMVFAVLSAGAIPTYHDGGELTAFVTDDTPSVT